MNENTIPKIIGVTGGTGYVGSRLISELKRRGHSLICIDIVTPKERNLVLPAGVEFREHDLRIPAEAEKALAGVDVVMHLAADIGSLTYMHDHQAEILVNNSQIDAAIYPAMVKSGVQHVIYSSSSMVFQYPPKFPYTEDDVEKINPPKNVYGYSKLSGEYFCRSFYEQYGLPFTILRYHNIYGPGEDSKGATPGDIHVIPALLEKVLVKKQYPLELIGDPESTRPFTYVDDAVTATAELIDRACLGSKEVMQEDFNIGNDTHYTILNLAEKIWSMYGDERTFAFVEVPTRANTALRREVDISKIRDKIGWEPRVTLEEGLPIVAEWIKGR
ncbi:MAG: UDP-glucose 4-epimerase [Candidatus Paceibacteria bacterium]|jgi:UDP-glucose 4-epimerase